MEKDGDVSVFDRRISRSTKFRGGLNTSSKMRRAVYLRQVSKDISQILEVGMLVVSARDSRVEEGEQLGDS